MSIATTVRRNRTVVPPQHIRLFVEDSSEVGFDPAQPTPSFFAIILIMSTQRAA